MRSFEELRNIDLKDWNKDEHAMLYSLLVKIYNGHEESLTEDELEMKATVKQKFGLGEQFFYFQAMHHHYIELGKVLYESE